MKHQLSGHERTQNSGYRGRPGRRRGGNRGGSRVFSSRSTGLSVCESTAQNSKHDHGGTVSTILSPSYNNQADIYVLQVGISRRVNRAKKCLSGIACSYCGQSNLDTLVKCVSKDCQKWFCNGCSDKDKGGSQKESHIITHLRASKHEQIGVMESFHSYEVIGFYCAAEGCHERDAFDLGMETGQDGRNREKHFCGHCAIKLKKITAQRRPFIDTHHRNLTCLNESIAKVPSPNDRQSCRRISSQDVADLERSWLITASGISLPGKLDEDCCPAMMATFSSSTEYFSHFQRLVELDLSLARMETAAIPRLENLTVAQRDTNQPALWFEFQTKSKHHKRALQSGQPVLVHFSSLAFRSPSKATVRSSKESNNVSTVRVEFSVEVGKNGETLPEDGLVAIEIAFRDNVFTRQLEALDRFGYLQPEIRDFILGSAAASFYNTTYTGCLAELPGRKLNDNQQAAVRLALSPCPFSLIQGPPGTGKTHTIIAIVKHFLLRNRNARILCCAPSNDPTNHLAMEFAKSGVDVLRIMSGRAKQNDLPPGLYELTLDYLLREEPVRQNNRRKSAKNNRESDAKAIIDRARVICTTCSMAAYRPLASWPPRDLLSVLIIDEATQATEADALVPITKQFDKVIMIGDHKQLGVVNRSRELERTNLGCSLFERMIRLDQVTSIMLDTQYRMHPQICTPASAIMYGGRLKTGEAIAAEREASGDAWQFLHLSPRFSPLIMLDIATSLHELAPDRSSSVNRHEARVVTLCLVNLLHRGGIRLEDVGVITFYNGQKECLKKMIEGHACIPQSARKRLMVDSVDAFQGREKDYIILSCVRSGDVGNISIGFLQNERRLNVAVTRAKKAILAVGDRKLLETSPVWRQFLKDYLHVKEEDAFSRLGAFGAGHQNCVFCHNVGLRNLNLNSSETAEDTTKNRSGPGNAGGSAGQQAFGGSSSHGAVVVPANPYGRILNGQSDRSVIPYSPTPSTTVKSDLRVSFSPFLDSWIGQNVIPHSPTPVATCRTDLGVAVSPFRDIGSDRNVIPVSPPTVTTAKSHHHGMKVHKETVDEKAVRPISQRDAPSLPQLLGSGLSSHGTSGGESNLGHNRVPPVPPARRVRNSANTRPTADDHRHDAVRVPPAIAAPQVRNSVDTRPTADSRRRDTIGKRDRSVRRTSRNTGCCLIM